MDIGIVRAKILGGAGVESITVKSFFTIYVYLDSQLFVKLFRNIIQKITLLKYQL